MERFNEPKVFIFNNDDLGSLIEDSYYVEYGHTGIPKEIQYKAKENNKLVNINFKFPDNLHEYRVMIIDLENKIEPELCLVDEDVDNKSNSVYVERPNKNFESAPFALRKILRSLDDKSLRIIFVDSTYEENYNFIEITNQNRLVPGEKFKLGVYDTLISEAINKSGYNHKTAQNNLSELINKYVTGYKVIFRFNYKDSDYAPLIYNDKNECISYIACSRQTGYELVLPICDNKEKLVSELLLKVLPSMLEEVFPESTEFSWIDNEYYKTEEELECIKNKEILLEQYNSKLEEIDKEQLSIKEQNKFFLDLLTETGSVLVEAVIKYFKWLGFENITDIDGAEEILREDLQLETSDCLYIIEVKGIGGTSTDSECAQVIKHRRLREIENIKKGIIRDIRPIYIVNHQRFINPNLRKNPPFSNHQIGYALDDERGLLTTWQLFQQYKLIQNGIFTKEETMNSLKEIGLISLLPNNFVELGTVKEYYSKPKASIVDIKDVKIEVGDFVWAKKNTDWVKGQVKSLELNDKAVESANNGEIGLVLDVELAVGYQLYIKKTILD